MKKSENLKEYARSNTNDFKNLSKNIKQPIKNFINLSKTYKNTRNTSNSRVQNQEDKSILFQNDTIANKANPNNLNIFYKSHTKNNSNRSKNKDKNLLKETFKKNTPTIIDKTKDIPFKSFETREQDLACDVKDFMKNELRSK